MGPRRDGRCMETGRCWERKRGPLTPGTARLDAFRVTAKMYGSGWAARGQGPSLFTWGWGCRIVKQLSIRLTSLLKVTGAERWGKRRPKHQPLPRATVLVWRRLRGIVREMVMSVGDRFVTFGSCRARAVLRKHAGL
jgi:hypothetical protein